MNNKSITRQNAAIIQRLLEQQAVKKLQESGTPTTALTPETNATRQMDQDVAASSTKSGIPAPVGATPSENNPALMGTITDPPAANLPLGTGPDQNGMHVPPSQYGGYGAVPGVPSQNPPATNTTDLGPASDATRQMDADVAAAKAKGGIPHMEALQGMDDEKLVAEFVESFGGIDGAMFALVANGCPLNLAEAIVKGEIVNEAFVRERLLEIFGSIFKKSEPSEGYKKHLAKRNAVKKAGSSVSSLKFDRSKNADSNDDTPFSATRKEGNDARRNK